MNSKQPWRTQNSLEKLQKRRTKSPEEPQWSEKTFEETKQIPNSALRKAVLNSLGGLENSE